MLNVRCSVFRCLGVGCWVLDCGWALGVGCWVLGVTLTLGSSGSGAWVGWDSGLWTFGLDLAWKGLARKV